MSNLDNPYSGMINLMRAQGSKYNSPDLLIGDVLSIEPILIKVGDLKLDKDSLYIADYLMPNYKREFKITGDISFSTSNITAPTNTATISHSHLVNSHSHQVTVDGKSGVASGTSGSTDTNTSAHAHSVTSISLSASNLRSNGEIIFTDYGLKVGDKVAIQQLNGLNKLVVYCKLI